MTDKQREVGQTVFTNEKPNGNPPSQRRSREEIELEKIAKQERKEVRAIAKKNKEDEKERRRLEKLKPETEKEIVHKYVNRLMNNQKYHGRVDDDKFKGIANKTKANKNIWMDNDFYFSVVFQSAEQKIKFINEIGIYEEDVEIFKRTGKLKIINGLEFAERLGIKLKKEEVSEYPTGNIDLMPYILDTETLDSQDK